MNILFVTLGNLKDLTQQGIYTDLLKEFKENDHEVYAICPMEKRFGDESKLVNFEGIRVLHAKTGNITQSSLIEKGISTILIEHNFKKAIKKYYSDINFDLIIYSTPPITFCNVIDYVKKRDNAKTFLLLKDIFPQNAVDLEMFSKKSIAYKYFRKKEIRLYNLSDHIGCMSKANMEYVLEHNNINKEKVKIAVNGFKPIINNLNEKEKEALRNKYHLPLDKKIFVYGGNLGKPQGIEFMIECLCARKDAEEFYLIVGSGTEFDHIKNAVHEFEIENVKVLSKLPKADYENLVKSCDVGLVFLDRRFTIPNFPSRLLSYMQAGIPILSCTDRVSDIGDFIETNKIGVACISESVDNYENAVNIMIDEKIHNISCEYIQDVLINNFTSKHTYEAIMEAIK